MKKVILAFLMLITCFNFFVPVTYAIENNIEEGVVKTVPSSEIMTVADVNKPIDVTADSNKKTMYYLSIPINQKMYFYRFNLVDMPVQGDILKTIEQNTSIKGFYNSFEESYIEKDMFTFIFTYTNVTVNNNPVITTWNIPIKNLKYDNPLFGWKHLYPISFDINTTVDINIRSEYYDLFKNADLSSITITILYRGSGYPMYRYSHKNGWWIFSEEIYSPYFTFSGIELKQREVPSDYDPIKEEGQAPDNGGIDLKPINEDIISSFNLFDYIKDSFKAAFEGNANVMQYIIVFVVSLVGLFLLGLIIEILTWIFK